MGLCAKGFTCSELRTILTTEPNRKRRNKSSGFKPLQCMWRESMGGVGEEGRGKGSFLELT